MDEWARLKKLEVRIVGTHHHRVHINSVAPFSSGLSSMTSLVSGSCCRQPFHSQKPVTS